MKTRHHAASHLKKALEFCLRSVFRFDKATLTRSCEKNMARLFDRHTLCCGYADRDQVLAEFDQLWPSWIAASSCGGSPLGKSGRRLTSFCFAAKQSRQSRELPAWYSSSAICNATRPSTSPCIAPSFLGRGEAGIRSRRPARLDLAPTPPTWSALVELAPPADNKSAPM